MALGKFSVTKKDGASDLAITGPGEIVCDVITGLSAAIAMLFQLRFLYGSGGESVKVYLQTNIDDGVTWIDIACVVFLLAPLDKALNFSANTPRNAFTPSDGTMTDDTSLDGVIGERMRLKIKVAGTYAGNTVLSGRILAK